MKQDVLKEVIRQCGSAIDAAKEQEGDSTKIVFLLQTLVSISGVCLGAMLMGEDDKGQS